MCRYYQHVADLDESYEAFCSFAEHTLANLLTSVMLETGFSHMNLMKTNLRNLLGQEYVSASMQIRQYAADHPELGLDLDVLLEFLKMISLSDEVKASIKARKEAREDRRVRNIKFGNRVPRSIDDLPEGMLAEHVSEAAIKHRNKQRKGELDYSVFQKVSYANGSEVLAAFKVEGVNQYYAAWIREYEEDTGFYTVDFCDGEERFDVPVDEILCYGWFRVGWWVFAPVKGSIDSCYEAKVTRANYYDVAEGDLVINTPHSEGAEVDLKFKKLESERKAAVEVMVSIQNLYMRL